MLFVLLFVAALYEEFSRALARFNHSLIATSVLSEQLQVCNHWSSKSIPEWLIFVVCVLQCRYSRFPPQDQSHTCNLCVVGCAADAFRREPQQCGPVANDRLHQDPGCAGRGLTTETTKRTRSRGSERLEQSCCHTHLESVSVHTENGHSQL